MNNILEVKNLSFSYTDNSGRNRMILEDVSLGFEEGKFLKNYYTETLEDAIEMYVYL